MMFRDDQPMCPECGDRALGAHPQFATRLRCDGCKGVLVPQAEVEELVSELQSEPWSLDDEARRDIVAGTRMCPRCAAKLTPIRLFGVPVDHCREHGVWFDGSELAMVLEGAAGEDPFLTEEGPQYAEMSPLAKLKTWFSSRHRSPRTPRRPKEE